ncbi:thermonuclease family protein [Patescibacteria group bacterium]|nr:thermonuclease family protein [Patescibacteria group bacterium]
MKTASIIAALTLLLAATGVTGYKIVKSKNYGGVEENLHKVVSVIDGDTFYIKGDSDDEDIRVRILSAFAPEQKECYFEESKQALKDLIEGKEVRLDKDISGADDYGRLLRHVVLPSGAEKEDNILISEYLIRNGFAKNVVISPDVQHEQTLDIVESKAIKELAGIWGNCKDLPKYFNKEEITDAQPTDRNCIIKGNVGQRGMGEKIYFIPGCSPYTRTKINIEDGDKYFCTEEEAQENGFRKSESCPG